MEQQRQQTNQANAEDAGGQSPGNGLSVQAGNSSSRRTFLSRAAALGAATAGGVAVAAAGLSANATSGGGPRRRLAMVIDLRRCTGCRACAVACKAENNVPLGAFRSYVSVVEGDHGRLATRRTVPRLCNHCRKPPCVKVCPVGATFKREDGTVVVNKDRCIGCRYCEVACPYGARAFRWHRVGSGDGLSWPARIYGTIDKCDFCVHRVDNGAVPACVNTCPAQARVFGDLNDPDSEVAKLVGRESVSQLQPGLGTEPSVFYIGLHAEAAEASMKAGPRVDPIRV